MKKIREMLDEYFAVIDQVDLIRFEESYHGSDPYYANSVIKKLEHLFYSEYGKEMPGKNSREYFLAPTVLASKKAGIAVLGIYLCQLDYTPDKMQRGKPSVMRIFVPEKYRQSERLKDFLQWSDHVNDGKLCYYTDEQQAKTEAQVNNKYDNRSFTKPYKEMAMMRQ